VGIRTSGAVRCIAILIGVAVLPALSATAWAQARIEGVVRRAGDDQPVAGVDIGALTLDEQFVGTATTAGDGSYTMFLPPASVRVLTGNALQLVDALHPGIACPFTQCDRTGSSVFVLAEGEVVTGVNFALVPGGSIAGQVAREGDGLPVEVPAAVQVDRADGTNLGLFDVAPDGTWAIQTGLPDGSYRAAVLAPARYASEVFDDRPCAPGGACDLASGDPIVVAAPAVTDVDFVLRRTSASLAGRVTALAGGAPLANVAVQALREGSGAPEQVSTNATGNYVFPALVAARYTVRALAPSPPLLTEFHPGVQCDGIGRCAGTATVFVLAAGDDVTGADFALAPAGSIQIGLRNADTGALMTGELRVLLPGFAETRQFFVPGGGSTDVQVLSGGGVRFAGRASFCGPASDRECLGERFPDEPCPSLLCDLGPGTPIAVAKAQTVSGIELLLSPGASVAGTVRAADDQSAIPGLTVELVDSGNSVVANAATDGDGQYTMVGVHVGPYFARTRAAMAFLDQLYDNVPCPGSACSPALGAALTPPAGGLLPDIDFALARGGAIAGKVTNEGFGAAIPGATVTVFDAGGAQVTVVVAAAGGLWTTAALPAGAYFVRAGAVGYESRLFGGLPCVDDACDPTSGMPVTVTPPTTSANIDVVLPGDGGLVVAPKTVFLNACQPGGCVVRGGSEDSRTDVSSIVSGTRNLPAFPFADGVRDAVVACVRGQLAPFQITLVTSDPSPQPHLEHMLTTVPGVIGFPSNVGGVSPFSCGLLANSISYTFVQAYGPDVAQICITAAHEIGHQFGLDHAFHCPDHMTYLSGCGFKSYTRADVSCGTFSPQACTCGAATQNSFVTLATSAGLKPVLFGDGFEEVPVKAGAIGVELGPEPAAHAPVGIVCGTDTGHPVAPTPRPVGPSGPHLPD
jgi:hypothetical protein